MDLSSLTVTAEPPKERLIVYTMLLPSTIVEFAGEIVKILSDAALVTVSVPVTALNEYPKVGDTIPLNKKTLLFGRLSFAIVPTV